MKQPSRMALPALLVLATVAPGPALAFYDDVHFGLTYYIARRTGFTPMQALRIAHACSATDFSADSEPTQLPQGASATLLKAVRYPVRTAALPMGYFSTAFVLSLESSLICYRLSCPLDVCHVGIGRFSLCFLGGVAARVVLHLSS